MFSEKKYKNYYLPLSNKLNKLELNFDTFIIFLLFAYFMISLLSFLISFFLIIHVFVMLYSKYPLLFAGIKIRVNMNVRKEVTLIFTVSHIFKTMYYFVVNTYGFTNDVTSGDGPRKK